MKEGEFMKKIVIIGIAFLFLFVGYASAQVTFGGKITSFTTKVSYEQELVSTNPKKSEGIKLVTVKTDIKGGVTFDPVLVLFVDTNGNPLEFDLFWIPVGGGAHIATLQCPFPAIISAERVVSVNATVRNDSVQGVAVCSFCPNGFVLGADSLPAEPLTCNAGVDLLNTGLTTAIAFVDFKGTVRENLQTDPSTPNSITIKGTIKGSGFNYRGELDWGTPNCTDPDMDGELCPAIFTGSFNTTLEPCPDPNCASLYAPPVM